jgi:hypothetical protein
MKYVRKKHLSIVRFLQLMVLTGCILGLSTGCAEKIAARERGNLAKPQMSLEPNALDAAIMHHTFSSKEAASGGYGVGGGGCGCN